MNILLIGAQGSGKGTQAERLAQVLGLSHVASGDLFRQAMDAQSDLGLQAQHYLKKGELVPDTITVAMVLEHIALPQCRSGILLDGFPRTLTQAEALDSNLRQIKQHIDLAVYLEVPREELMQRLEGRYLCRAQQHVYNIQTAPPRIAGICDIDGSELYRRVDDTGEAIQKRLDIFFNETILLLDYYRRQQKLVVVNGHQAIDRVYKDMVSVVEDAMNEPGLLTGDHTLTLEGSRQGWDRPPSA